MHHPSIDEYMHVCCVRVCTVYVHIRETASTSVHAHKYTTVLSVITLPVTGRYFIILTSLCLHNNPIR